MRNLSLLINPQITTMNPRIITCLLTLAFLSTASAQMSFDDALKGWTGFQYNKEAGLENKSGELTHPGFLGCSGFASIILQRMKYGNDAWLKDFDFKVQQVYGDEAAALMGLKLAGAKAVSDWKASPPAKGFYFFNVRNGKEGHVGFVQIDGSSWIQHQYSGLSPNNGYVKGSFFDWQAKSQYKNSPVELYLVSF